MIRGIISEFRIVAPPKWAVAFVPVVFGVFSIPQISLWGRALTFRWIIPGYDQVLVGPICALLVGPMAMSVFWNSRVPGEICLSIASGLTVHFALISPPRLRHWRLTGHHRLVPALQESQSASVHKMGQP